MISITVIRNVNSSIERIITFQAEYCFDSYIWLFPSSIHS